MALIGSPAKRKVVAMVASAAIRATRELPNKRPGNKPPPSEVHGRRMCPQT